jgi:hypothetical protein
MTREGAILCTVRECSREGKMVGRGGQCVASSAGYRAGLVNGVWSP